MKYILIIAIVIMTGCSDMIINDKQGAVQVDREITVLQGRWCNDDLCLLFDDGMVYTRFPDSTQWGSQEPFSIEGDLLIVDNLFHWEDEVRFYIQLGVLYIELSTSYLAFERK